MFFEVKGRKLVPGKGRPQAVGTAWVSDTGKYLHGPRIESPELFSKVYHIKPKWAKKRKLILKKMPKDTKFVKAGTLKKTGRLAVQSYVRPIPKWVKVRRSKMMKSKRGRLFSRKNHLRKNYGAKIGGLYEISDVIKAAEKSGMAVRPGAKHPYMIQAEGQRPFPVAESTSPYAVEKYFKVVTELPPRQIKDFLRGKERKNYGSHLLRDQIEKKIRVVGPIKGKNKDKAEINESFKQKVITTMEKDPLLWGEYKEYKRPKIRLVPGLINTEEKRFGRRPWGKKEIEIDPTLFFGSASQTEPELKTKIAKTPQTVTAHELSHVKHSDYLREKLGEKEAKRIGEEIANIRSTVDIKKLKLPQYSYDIISEDAMGWILDTDYRKRRKKFGK